MEFDKIIAILNVTVPFVTAIILSWINNTTGKKQMQDKTLRERFNKFYFPFYKEYISLSLYAEDMELSHMDLQVIENITFLCIDNMYLMDTNSQKYVPDLYKAYLDLIEIKHDKSYILVNDTQQHKTFNKIFNNLTKSVLAEYRCICNKLKLPKPTL